MLAGAWRDTVQTARRLGAICPHYLEVRYEDLLLITEDGQAGSPRASHTEDVTSYRESFKEELIHFHDCVSGGRRPITSGPDALHDIALCEAVVAVHQSRTPRARPSEPAMATAPSEHS